MQNIYRLCFVATNFVKVEGIFVSSPEDIQSLVGEKLNFSGALEEDIDAHGIFTTDHFKLVTDDQEFVKKFQQYNLESGYSPWDGW